MSELWYFDFEGSPSNEASSLILSSGVLVLSGVDALSAASANPLGFQLRRFALKEKERGSQWRSGPAIHAASILFQALEHPPGWNHALGAIEEELTPPPANS